MTRKIKPRMNRMTQSESRWIKIILDAKLGQDTPFYATQAVAAIISERERTGKKSRWEVPNKFRLNTVLKKCKKFNRTKDGANRNHWTLKEEV